MSEVSDYLPNGSGHYRKKKHQNRELIVSLMKKSQMMMVSFNLAINPDPFL